MQFIFIDIYIYISMLYTCTVFHQQCKKSLIACGEGRSHVWPRRSLMPSTMNWIRYLGDGGPPESFLIVFVLACLGSIVWHVEAYIFFFVFRNL